MQDFELEVVERVLARKAPHRERAQEGYLRALYAGFLSRLPRQSYDQEADRDAA